METNTDKIQCDSLLTFEGVRKLNGREWDSKAGERIWIPNSSPAY